jgi:hypothetical protein
MAFAEDKPYERPVLFRARKIIGGNPRFVDLWKECTCQPKSPENILVA